MPHRPPEQVSAACTSHPMGGAGPRWSNKVSWGGWGEETDGIAGNVMQNWQEDERKGSGL